MVYQSGTDVEKRPALVHAIRTMPRWKWRLLSIGLVIGTIGLVSQVSAFLNTPHDPVFAPHVQAAPGPSGSGASPPNSSSPGAYPDTPPRPPAPAPDAGTDPTPPWKPFMTRVGFSLFVGITVGTIFRTFLRIALTLTALVAAAAAGLSYYHVVNVDLTAVNRETTLFTGWLADQGYRLKDTLFHALPSSTAAGIGFFLGLKRR